MSESSQSGKGSKRRPESKSGLYAEGHDRVFHTKPWWERRDEKEKVEKEKLWNRIVKDVLPQVMSSIDVYDLMGPPNRL